jgi:hypothetical protein
VGFKEYRLGFSVNGYRVSVLGFTIEGNQFSCQNSKLLIRGVHLEPWDG